MMTEQKPNKSRQPGRLHFREVRNWGSDQLWVSRRFNDCDWPLRIFIRCEDMREYLSERDLKEFGSNWHVSIVAVSPDALDSQTLQRAREYCGVDFEQWQTANQITRCEVLINYGTYATLWQEAGNNREKLLRSAREFCQLLPIMIGFALDKRQNAIGSTGWDFLQGNSLAGLYREPDTQEKQIMRKMGGQ